MKEKQKTRSDPLWYKDAIIYELHIRAFADSDGDGIGDLKGLTWKLDYLQELGIDTIWLLPFTLSPLRDDGYDISDYKSIHPTYGNLSDFRVFLKEAHRRDLKVIIELVLNHTSDQHQWFQRARQARSGTRWRDFYVWSDTPDRYSDARVIFNDFESSNWTWDSLAGAYYWHRFFAHQPDLNYENPQVRKAMFQVMDFWLGMGVDGFRLDALPYLFEREETNCENLPETLSFIGELRAYIDSRHKDRVLLAEANQWPEDAVAYFGKGDRCQMAFHFPLMPRLFMALRMEDRFPIIDILEQTPEIPGSCQWALFLRNHDELTLEMVTDEERDYMYRVYAQDRQARLNLGIRRRLAPLLGNHRRRIELMNGLLFSLPGSPIIYYGDEIGMGDNIYLGDRNSVRTPMQWSSDRNAGFSRANPQRLYLPVIIDPEYHFDAVNVETQLNNPHSLLWWMKRLISLRRKHKAFSRGTIRFLTANNRKILAFIRSYKNERILVAANLSRFVQCVDLELDSFRGLTPVEIFGRTEFPRIEDKPYFLSIGPHSFYWLELVDRSKERDSLEVSTFLSTLPTFRPKDNWTSLFEEPLKTALENRLSSYLPGRRWFGAKGRLIRSVTIREIIPVKSGKSTAILALLRVSFTEGDSETYFLPFSSVEGPEAARLLKEEQQMIVARLRFEGKQEGAVLCDAVMDKKFCRSLLELLLRRRHQESRRNVLTSTVIASLERLRTEFGRDLEPTVLRGEHSNTSIVYEEKLILKLFRRLDTGMNPDFAVSQFLGEKGFRNSPQLIGGIHHTDESKRTRTLAVCYRFVENEGNAWKYTLDRLDAYFERALACEAEGENSSIPETHFLELAKGKFSRQVENLVGDYLGTARLLGQRTAELHVALASETKDPAFIPEPFSRLYQRSLYQSMRSLTTRVFETLRQNLAVLPESLRNQATEISRRESQVLESLRTVVTERIKAKRLRCHGDYHLGQVLYTGNDFVIMDFEGEPARPISERNIKRSPLRDVAGMLRSFHYAAYSSLFSLEERGLLPPEEDLRSKESWADYWYYWVSTAFLKEYLVASRPGSYLPESAEQLRILLDAYLLEKAVYELGYELNNRPEWVKIPLKGIRHLLDKGSRE